MFKDIKIEPNNREQIELFDAHDISIRRGAGDSAELVIYPCKSGRLSIRFAKEPYACRLWFDGKDYRDISLDDESDWGDIETSDPRHPKCGNEVDGYRIIESVELFDGVPHGTMIPLDEFCRDVDDFIVFHGC